MSELGTFLREGREEKGLSLDEAERGTRIRRPLLEALEEGSGVGLPDAVYARGLVVTYARFLGVDEKRAKALFEAEYMPSSNGDHDVGSYQPVVVPLYLTRSSWLKIGLVTAAVAALVFLTWWNWPLIDSWLTWLARGAPGWRSLLPREQIVPASTQEPTVALAIAATATPSVMPAETGLATVVLPTPTSEALPLPTPTTEPTATPTVPPSPTPAVEAGLHLVLDFTSPAWIRVQVDGDVVYEGTLGPGETREWRAEERIVLLTGNAGGTRVTINGDEVGVLGEAGAVVERAWSIQDGTLVEAPSETGD